MDQNNNTSVEDRLEKLEKHVKDINRSHLMVAGLCILTLVGVRVAYGNSLNQRRGRIVVDVHHHHDQPII